MAHLCDGDADDARRRSAGLEQITGLQPVYPGDTLSGRTTVLQARVMLSRPTMGVVGCHWQLFNQTGDGVLSMAGCGMFGRPPA